MSGDQTSWTGTAGSSVTLRLEWDTSGAPAFDPADSFTVEARLPNGAAVGSQWTGSISGGSGSTTRTFHFDDNPLDQAAGTARAGMLELYLLVQDTAGPTTWSADSRGSTSSPPIGTTHDWAEGYLRAPFVLSSETLSNVALGGAEPGTWAFPDPIHAQATLSAVSYRATSPTFSVRDSGSPVRSGSASSGTGVTKSVSFTGSNVVDNSFDVDTDDVRWAFSAQNFGGDNENTWATTGHASGWSRTDELTLDDAARMVVDPRITIWRDSGGTTVGANAFSDAGRTNACRVFRRRT
ncbi:MAG: hypothetical protein R3324_21220, partial [Halobacteriales archaeon]|nr:hypothetical protein [Halobacteriales archaeon]